ncbi:MULTISPECIES: diacylglycerol/lipid kinase family protein [unclassified Luteococcus]|uniref:diacylglycerol/lipid kinase family protein n=1 Tax=unclassified Luteococcus TaxID=2639923 RepID=UPI00313C96A0
MAVLNPVAKQYGRAVRGLLARARDEGWPDPVILHTTRHDSGGGQAEEALAIGADLVIVGGGDGTVRAVAERVRGTGIELGILPLGTANIFARNLGLSPRRLDDAVDAAARGRAQALDLGVASFRTAGLPGQPSREHLFLVLAGLGHDAETVRGTRLWLKRRIGWLAYFESGAHHLVAPPVRMMIGIDGQTPHARALWSFLVGNAGRIPMGIEVFPEARLDDGKLRTMEARVTHLWHWLPVAVAGARRTARTPVLVHGTARRVHLVPDQPTALQLDGDVFGPVVEVDIRVDPGALLVRRPAPRTKGMTR